MHVILVLHVLTFLFDLISSMLELKRSGEEEWKKRISKTYEGETPTGPVPIEVVRLREKTGRGPAQRPSSIQDRLSLLQGAQEEWRSKVEKDKDVEKLTVEGKMKTAGKNIIANVVGAMCGINSKWS